jgi:hypothetical protein
MVAMFRKMLEDDRRRVSWSLGRAAWALGVSIRSPSFETWDRICRLFGWPQTFVTFSGPT